MCRAGDKKKFTQFTQFTCFPTTKAHILTRAEQRNKEVEKELRVLQKQLAKRLKEEAVAEVKARQAAFEESVQKLSTSTYTGEFLDGQRHGQGESSLYGIDDVVVYFFSSRMRSLPILLY